MRFAFSNAIRSIKLDNRRRNVPSQYDLPSIHSITGSKLGGKFLDGGCLVFPPLSPPRLSIDVLLPGKSRSEYEGIRFMLEKKKKSLHVLKFMVVNA